MALAEDDMGDGNDRDDVLGGPVSEEEDGIRCRYWGRWG